MSKKFAHAEILRQSGIETTRNPSSYISQALTQNQTIPFSLADFVLDHTINSGDPMERAMIALAAAGIPAEDLPSLRTVIEKMRPVQTSAKPLSDAEADAAAELNPNRREVALRPIPKKNIDIPGAVREDAPPYEKKEPVGGSDTREAWQIVKQQLKKSKDFDTTSIGPAPAKAAIQTVPDLKAAADYKKVGGPIVAETEAADVRYDRKNHFILKVVGRSMWPTMMEGDRIICEHVHFHMPIYDEDRGNCDRNAWKALDGEVVLAQVDDDQFATVIKRIEVTHRNDTGFKISLRSDNPKVKSIEIQKSNSLTIIGIVREIIRSPKQVD